MNIQFTPVKRTISLTAPLFSSRIKVNQPFVKKQSIASGFIAQTGRVFEKGKSADAKATLIICFQPVFFELTAG